MSAIGTTPPWANKRHGRPFDDSDELSSPFIARQIATPIVTACCIDASMAPAAAARTLADGRFDQAPVVDDGRTVGWVTAEALNRANSVRQVMTALAGTPILAASTSIADVLPHLVGGFAFTVRDAGLRGFVVPSDLDRHAARGHFYVALADIEIQLSDLIAGSVPDGTVETAIDRAAPAAGRLRKAQQAGIETRVVEYLDLRDLAHVFRAYVDPQMTPSMSEKLDRAVELRNTIMHATKPLASSYAVHELANLNRQLRDLRHYLHTGDVAGSVQEPGGIPDV